MKGQISRKLKGLDAAIQTGSVRALNKALTSAKAQITKDLRSDTGLKTEVIKSRVLALKANSKRMSVSLNFAVKVGVSLRHLSPKPKNVKRGKRTYQGVTATLGGRRELVPGAFLLDNKAGLFPVARKLSFTNGTYSNSKAPRYPLIQLRTDVFLHSVRNRQAEVKAKIHTRFNEIANHEIDFAVSQRMNQNKGSK